MKYYITYNKQCNKAELQSQVSFCFFQIPLKPSDAALYGLSRRPWDFPRRMLFTSHVWTSLFQESSRSQAQTEHQKKFLNIDKWRTNVLHM